MKQGNSHRASTALHMKRTYLISAIMAMAMTAQADDYGYLVIGLQDGTEQALPTGGLTMVFADGQLTAKAQGTTATFEQAQLSKMYFSDQDLSGIGSVGSEEPTTIRVSDRLLQVAAPAGARVIIASVGGMLIDRYTAGAEPINTPLRPGIYVVKINDKSTKIHVR